MAINRKWIGEPDQPILAHYGPVTMRQPGPSRARQLAKVTLVTVLVASATTTAMALVGDQVLAAWHAVGGPLMHLVGLL